MPQDGEFAQFTQWTSANASPAAPSLPVVGISEATPPATLLAVQAGCNEVIAPGVEAAMPTVDDSELSLPPTPLFAPPGGIQNSPQLDFQLLP